MKCGHCGTEVNDGFTVCTGCGARYKSSAKRVVFGAAVLLSMLLIAPVLLKNINGGSVGAVIIIVGGAVVLIVGGFRAQWYRYGRRR